MVVFGELFNQEWKKHTESTARRILNDLIERERVSGKADVTEMMGIDMSENT